jgi:hypothetical protein
VSSTSYKTWITKFSTSASVTASQQSFTRRKKWTHFIIFTFSGQVTLVCCINSILVKSLIVMQFFLSCASFSFTKSHYDTMKCILYQTYIYHIIIIWSHNGFLLLENCIHVRKFVIKKINFEIIHGRTGSVVRKINHLNYKIY